MDDGTRTHDNRDHNPGLYQLSYAHHPALFIVRLACPAGLEPATLGLEGRCSIRLSYGHDFQAPLAAPPHGGANHTLSDSGSVNLQCQSLRRSSGLRPARALPLLHSRKRVALVGNR